jgi:hypothetical protein
MSLIPEKNETKYVQQEIQSYIDSIEKLFPQYKSEFEKLEKKSECVFSFVNFGNSSLSKDKSSDKFIVNLSVEKEDFLKENNLVLDNK